MNKQHDVTLIRIEGTYPHRVPASPQAFKNMNHYLAWENQRKKNEPSEIKGITAMLLLNRRAKIKLVKKLCPDYQVESLNFSNYTAQELSEIWQDDDLLDEILCELINTLPNEE